MSNAFEAAFVGAPYVGAYVHNTESFGYNTDTRPRRNIAATVAYTLLAILTLAGSIPIFIRTDKNTGLYSNRFFSSSSTCDVQKYQQVAWMYNDAEFDPTFMRRFKGEITIWIPATAGLAVLGSFFYIFVFCRFPRTMLALALLGCLLAGAAVSTLCFTSGYLPAGIALAIFTALAAGFVLWVGRWAPTFGELLAVAASSLQRTSRLLPAVLGIQLAGLTVVAYCLAAFFSAITYGYVSRNWDAVKRSTKGVEDSICIDASRQRVPCCIFVTHPLAHAYAAVAALFVLWSAALAIQVKTFTAADTLAQWYFSPVMPAYNTFSTLGIRPTAAASAPPGATRRALRHCLTSAFGSLALAAVALPPLRVVRWICQGLLRAKGIGRALGCVLRPVASRTERFTRFATVSTAITGEPFASASSSVFNLLQRNFLPTYGLWWIPGPVMLLIASLLSLGWAGLVFFVTFATNREYKPIVFDVSLATAGVVFFEMLYGLLFTTGLQLDVVNTLYVCYAADKDQRRAVHPEVHSVIRLVPGQAVQQHRSALVYGIPEDPPGRLSAPEHPFDVSAVPTPPSAMVAAEPSPSMTARGSAVAMEGLQFDGVGGAAEVSPRSGFGAVSIQSVVKRRAI